MWNKHSHAINSMAKVSDETLSAAPSLPGTWWEIKNYRLAASCYSLPQEPPLWPERLWTEHKGEEQNAAFPEEGTSVFLLSKSSQLSSSNTRELT